MTFSKKCVAFLMVTNTMFAYIFLTQLILDYQLVVKVEMCHTVSKLLTSLIIYPFFF